MFVLVIKIFQHNLQYQIKLSSTMQSKFYKKREFIARGEVPNCKIMVKLCAHQIKIPVMFTLMY